MAVIIKIQLQGWDSTLKYFETVPKKIEKDVMFANEELARFIQRSARAKASRGWTGYLASTIMVQSTKKTVSVVVTAPYSAYVETGKHPKVIPIEYFEQHMSSPGTRGIDTRTLGMKPRAWVFPKPAAPFMAPAIQSGLANFPKILSRAMNKALSS